MMTRRFADAPHAPEGVTNAFEERSQLAPTRPGGAGRLCGDDLWAWLGDGLGDVAAHGATAKQRHHIVQRRHDDHGDDVAAAEFDLTAHDDHDIDDDSGDHGARNDDDRRGADDDGSICAAGAVRLRDGHDAC